MNPVYITFSAYLIGMLAVGIFCCRKTATLDDYLLVGRGIGSWVTAFSAQASDMSGWLLMGLPGAVYFAGSGASWIAIGLLAGTFLNWIWIAPRLRIYTEKTGSLTLSSFFAARFRDPTHLLRTLSAVIVLIFFTIYAASGLVATGKLFHSVFGMDYMLAVLIGTGVIFSYTLIGGYLAVCWTDLLQGVLMFAALVAVPLTAIFSGNGGCASGSENFGKLTFSLFPDGYGAVALTAILSSAVWGLGYCGQPHILTRFMSIKSAKLLPKTTAIAMVWVTISLCSAVLIGLLSVRWFPGLDQVESEKVFIMMIDRFCSPWIAGIFLAAILAAVMSTIDSQLLVSSSTLTADFYRGVLRKNAGQAELVKAGRWFVAVITLIACVLALSPRETIFGIVKFAWGGFGTAFGPAVIMALYSRRTTWQSVLCGMIAGTLVMVVWYAAGLSCYMYEILPGFLANLVTVAVMNCVFSQRDRAVLAEFDAVAAEVRGGKSPRR